MASQIGEIEEDILDSITQHIDEEFAYGQYREVSVMIRKSDGYVNATKLCKKAGKRISNWYTNAASKKHIDEISELINHEYDPIYTIENGKSSTRGTYVSLKLLPEIIRWIGKDRCEAREADVRDRLAKLVDGKIEVSCLHGRIDVLSATEIIEVKIAKKWKYAWGQIMAYGKDFPDHKPRIHLFDVPNTMDRDEITGFCLKHGINVTYEAD
jgi:hypothetical protein